MQGHALRAAINTPIQGSAADVATAAMLSIDACQELKELGWKMLLQVPLPPVKLLRMHACHICNHGVRGLNSALHLLSEAALMLSWALCL